MVLPLKQLVYSLRLKVSLISTCYSFFFFLDSRIHSARPFCRPHTCVSSENLGIVFSLFLVKRGTLHSEYLGHLFFFTKHHGKGRATFRMETLFANCTTCYNPETVKYSSIVNNPVETRKQFRL